MSRIDEQPAGTITLVSALSSEEAQTSWWRPIQWKWPEFSHSPSLQILDWQSACDPEVPIAGAAVLLIASDAVRSWIFPALDRLREAHIPAIMLQPSTLSEGVSDEDTLVLPDSTDPAVVASALAALAARQPAVEALRAEVRISRRFHGGLRGEIEKIHEELQLAASVQREFLPRDLPSDDGFDLRVLFRPCGYVSGDIYDAQRLDDDHIGFFVADAVGHGVPAALMTMVLCRCLPTIEGHGDHRSIVPPSRALRMLNQDLILRHGEGSRFATAVYGVINTRTRRVTLAGAGHPYPLRIKGDRVERAETEGGLLGLSQDDEFPEVTFSLERGELLVVYTDGFETAFPAPNVDAYGRRLPNRNYIDRFVDLARRAADEGLPHAVMTLLEEIDRQTGSLHQADDLTALVLSPTAHNALDRLIAGDASSSAPREPDLSHRLIR